MLLRQENTVVCANRWIRGHAAPAACSDTFNRSSPRHPTTNTLCLVWPWVPGEAERLPDRRQPPKGRSTLPGSHQNRIDKILCYWR